MSDALKPCPFCGEAEHLYPAYRGLGEGQPYAIDCIGCGMDFVPRDGMDVVAMWNRRAPDTALVAALTGLLDRYTALVNCGDCGNWNPESEDEVKAAREALSRIPDIQIKGAA